MRIGLTGATGFVGSALAARFLAEGKEILALSRLDNDGSRTLAAIESAFHGLGLPAPARWKSKIQIASLEPANGDFTGLGEFWHCAAEMSYSFQKLSESTAFNVGVTTELFNKFCEQSNSRGRFYYLSTAFITPSQTAQRCLNDGVEIPEVLNPACDARNAYQLTKHRAERALSIRFRTRPPEFTRGLTILRPSIIIGHPVSGWGGGKPNGYYQFVDAFRAARQLGLSKIQFSLAPEIAPNLVTIDSVVQAAAGLSASYAERSDAELSIFHCTGSAQVKNRTLLEIMSELSGIEFENGAPTNSFERRVSNILDGNRPFAESTWSFSHDQLNARIGGGHWQTRIGATQMWKITSEYLLSRSPRSIPAGGVDALASA